VRAAAKLIARMVENEEMGRNGVRIDFRIKKTLDLPP
jgi:hypothetical protein